MSKTYRELPVRQCRAPRGRMAALRRGDRAIPPSAWDDIRYGGEVERPWDVLYSMVRRGDDPNAAVDRVVRRFHVAQWQKRRMRLTARDWRQDD